jgi:CBS domain-containing protein
MTPSTAWISPENTLAEAAAILNGQSVFWLLVMDGANVVGVVSERDIMVQIASEAVDPGKTPVREIMSMEPFCCGVDDNVGEVTIRMEKRKSALAVVLDKARRPVGILSVGRVWPEKSERWRWRPKDGTHSSGRMTNGAKHASLTR